MKRIILLVGGILVSLLVVDRVLAYSLDKIYNKTQWGETGGHINYYLSLEKTPDLLVVGDSRAHLHVIPDSFTQKAFSLCHHGMELPFQTGLLSVLAQHKKLPKTVLLHISPENFVTPLDRDLLYLHAQYLNHYYGENDLVTQYINGISSTEYVLYFLKSYRYNGKVINILKNYYKTRQQTPTHTGFEALIPTDADSTRTLIQLKKLQPVLEANDTFQTSILAGRVLDDAVKICQQNNVRLICFTSPVYYNTPTKRDILAHNLLENYFKNHNILYWDYIFNKPPVLQPLSNWRDVYHLNLNGAKILSQELKKSIDALPPQ